MKTVKYHRLPQPRVDKATYEGIHQIAEEQTMSIAEVIRAALEEYITPTEPPEFIAIPIAGKIKPCNGEYIILPTHLFGDREGAGQQEGSPQNGMDVEELEATTRADTKALKRYLEFETIPPTAPSLAQKP